MITPDLSQFVVTQYDAAVAGADGPIALEDTRAAIIPAVASYLEGADRDYETEARMIVNSVLKSERSKRSNQLRRDLDYVLDYLANPEDAAFGIEAIVERAYALGTSKGEDCTLAQWTGENFTNLVTERYRVAAKDTAAAVQLDETVQRVLDLMDARGAATFGEITPTAVAEVA